jgi:hypothetical protein
MGELVTHQIIKIHFQSLYLKNCDRDITKITCETL